MLQTLKHLWYGCLIVFNISISAQASPAILDVTANVPPFCTVKATPLAFGPYNLAKSLQKSAISLLCTKGTIFYISLDNGSSNIGEGIGRAMTYGNNKLQYKLYKDSKMAQIWGSGVNEFSSVGTGTNQSFSIYGAIPENQKLLPGNYIDIINASIILKGTEQTVLSYQIILPISVTATIIP